ncbi:SKI/DACH domain-containing protein 1 [Stigmatopora argus]
MGDVECGFEEMQGVRLGYLLIRGKQMFALSQVFTELLKNIPRTTVHKRMDHLNVKKHQCDLDELRKLKAINSIAFHAAKCTLISREDVEALYFSCKTERVFKSGNNKRKATSCANGGSSLVSAEILHADPELWQKKVWFTLHGVQDKAARREICDSKLPHLDHRTQARDYRSTTKSTHRHIKNYETTKIHGNRVTWSQRDPFFRGAPVAALQSAMAAQSKLSRAADDPHHKRKRRREGGGVKHAWKSRHHQHHPHDPPVLVVQPKSSNTHRAAFEAFHLSRDFYLHPHHIEPSFESSDTESSTTYSERAYPDSDFGSGFSTSSSSEEEEEDEDDTQSESTEVSSDEEESSSHSDSSSVSSRGSVQSIRFRRARVGTLAKTLNPIKAPLVLQPTFHYNHRQLQQHDKSAQSQGENDQYWNNSGPKFLSLVFTGNKCDQASPNADSVLERGRFESQVSKALNASRRTSTCATNEQCGWAKDSKSTVQMLPTPPKKIKNEIEELSVTGSPRPETGVKIATTLPFALHKVKLKVEDCHDEFEYQTVKFKEPAINTEQYSSSSVGQREVKYTENTPGVAPVHKDQIEERETRSKKCLALELGKRSRLSRAQSKQARVTRATSSSFSSSSSTTSSSSSAENFPSGHKCSTANTSMRRAKMPFSLMANFPFSPSLVVGSDGDLCPAYSLNSLRGPGTPPPSHPVWSWQPGGHIFPPPHTHRTGK